MTTTTPNPNKRASFVPDEITTSCFPSSPTTKSRGVKSNHIYYQCYSCQEVRTELRDLGKHWDKDNAHAAGGTWSHFRAHMFKKDAETGKHVEYYVADVKSSQKIWKPCARDTSTGNRDQNGDAAREKLNMADAEEDQSNHSMLISPNDGIRRFSRTNPFKGSFTESHLLNLDGKDSSSENERSIPHSTIDQDTKNPARHIEDTEISQTRNPAVVAEQAFYSAIDDAGQSHETYPTSSAVTTDEIRDFSESQPSHLVADDGTQIKQGIPPEYPFHRGTSDVDMQESTMTDAHPSTALQVEADPLLNSAHDYLNDLRKAKAEGFAEGHARGGEEGYSKGYKRAADERDLAISRLEGQLNSVAKMARLDNTDSFTGESDLSKRGDGDM